MFIVQCLKYLPFASALYTSDEITNEYKLIIIYNYFYGINYRQTLNIVCSTYSLVEYNGQHTQ